MAGLPRLAGWLWACVHCCFLGSCGTLCAHKAANRCMKRYTCGLLLGFAPGSAESESACREWANAGEVRGQNQVYQSMYVTSARPAT